MRADASNEFLCMISVDNLTFTPELIEAYRKWGTDQGCRVRPVVLTKAERHNIRAFEQVSLEVADKQARLRGQTVQKLLEGDRSDFLTFEEVCEQTGAEGWLRHLTERYFSDRHFQRHCLNETFSNLRARLRDYGVERRDDRLVEQCVWYLVEELALKVASRINGPFAGEILPKPESSLVLRLYEGEYIEGPVARRSYLLVEHDGAKAREIRAGNVAS